MAHFQSFDGETEVYGIPLYNIVCCERVRRWSRISNLIITKTPYFTEKIADKLWIRMCAVVSKTALEDELENRVVSWIDF